MKNIQLFKTFQLRTLHYKFNLRVRKFNNTNPHMRRDLFPSSFPPFLRYPFLGDPFLRDPFLRDSLVKYLNITLEAKQRLLIFIPYLDFGLVLAFWHRNRWRELQ